MYVFVQRRVSHGRVFVAWLCAPTDNFEMAERVLILKHEFVTNNL